MPSLDEILQQTMLGAAAKGIGSALKPLGAALGEPQGVIVDWLRLT